MSEEHELAARVLVFERLRDVRRLAEPVAVVVLDAREVEAGLSVADRDALVAEDAHAELAELLTPGVAAGVKFVIARDEIGAVARSELGYRRNGVGEVGDGTVHEIARD